MYIPYGYCQCGCGIKTKIPKRTGCPNRFILHHNTSGIAQNRPGWKGGRIKDPSGYIKIYSPFHPRAAKNHVLEHILIAEQILGKPLPPKCEIHHCGRKDENKKIVICENHEYHQLIHVRERAYRACGNASFRKCRFCKQYDDVDNLYITHKNIFHKACRNKDYRERISKNAKKNQQHV